MLKNKNVELNESNQKQLQKIFEQFLYYARAIDLKMVVAINFLETVKTNPKI